MAQLNLTADSITVIPNVEVLKSSRASKQETQRQVEDATKISSPRLCQYESGSPISLGHLKRLSEYYNLSIAALTHPNDADRMRGIIRDLQSYYPPKNGDD